MEDDEMGRTCSKHEKDETCFHLPEDARGVRWNSVATGGSSCETAMQLQVS